MTANHGFSRRDWLRVSAGGLFGPTACGWLDHVAARAAAAPAGRPKSCIVLWMPGGVAQTDTFDMKPDGPENVRGEFKPIRSAVPGLDVCEHLPKTAARAKHLAVLRSLHTSEGTPSHPKAMPEMHTAGLGEGVGVSKPCLGAVVSAGLDRDCGLPTHIRLGPVIDVGPGFLGARHGAVSLDATSLKALTTPPLAKELFDERNRLFDRMQKDFAKEYPAAAVDAQTAGYRKAIDLMNSAKVKQLELDAVPAATREAFGRNSFGDRCLLAAKMVEAGVPFVEAGWDMVYQTITASRPWDTHRNNFPALKAYLPVLDAAWSALLDYLAERGLLDTTLVVWMGEMGRGPRVDAKAANGGRSHFGKGWTVVLAGGGLRTGRVVGATTPEGGDVKDRPITGPDLMATVCAAVGVPPDGEFHPKTGKLLDRADPTQAMTAGRVRVAAATAKPVAEVLP